MPPARIGASYVNFFYPNHDGLGVRPLKGILNKKDLKTFISTLKKFGSKFTYRKSKKKSVIYEANISLGYDAGFQHHNKDNYFYIFMCMLFMLHMRVYQQFTHSLLNKMILIYK